MGRVFFIFNQKMSAFEDEFEAVPPVSEVDPAAEFLAKEQEELGDIGEDLGLGAPQDFPAAVDENFGGNIEDEEGKDIYAGMQNLSIKKDQEEPEFITKWKEEQKEKAKKELEDWYKRYEGQLEKTKSSNREEETKYESNELNGIEPGTEWERVAKHCDFSAKAPGHTKDVSRMRTIMLQLKQNQPVKA